MPLSLSLRAKSESEWAVSTWRFHPAPVAWMCTDPGGSGRWENPLPDLGLPFSVMMTGVLLPPPHRPLHSGVECWSWALPPHHPLLDLRVLGVQCGLQSLSHVAAGTHRGSRGPGGLLKGLNLQIQCLWTVIVGDAQPAPPGTPSPALFSFAPSQGCDSSQLFCLRQSWQSMTLPYWKFSAISLCSWELSASSFSLLR